MVKIYIEELNEKSQLIFEIIKKEQDLDSLTRYVQSFNEWELGTVQLVVPTRPIFEDGLFNSSILAEESFFLITHGFYANAMCTLRNLLDCFLTRLFFDVEYSKPNPKYDYNEWNCGIDCRFPAKKEVLNKIFNIENVKEFGNDLREDTDILLKHLSKFVHSRPPIKFGSRSSIGNLKYDKEQFDEWISFMKSIYYISSTLILLIYPKMIESKPIQLLKLNNPEYFEKIEKILKSTNKT